MNPVVRALLTEKKKSPVVDNFKAPWQAPKPPGKGRRFSFTQPVMPGAGLLVVLLVGIDTLKIFWRCPIDAGVVKKLRELKEDAKATPGAELPEITIDGVLFKVKPNSTVKGEILLQNKAFDMNLAPGAPVDAPTVYVEFHSWYLWEVTADKAVARAQHLVYHELSTGSASPEQLKTHVSEIHLCKDFQGWTPDRTQLELHRKWSLLKCRGRDNIPRGSSGAGPRRSYTGQSYGKKNAAIAAAIYNKTLEIEDASNKTWFQKLYEKSGLYDAQLGDVWRLEFRLKREGLHEFLDTNKPLDGNFDTWEQVRQYTGLLWERLCTRWLVMHNINSKGKEQRKATTRRTIHPAWQKIAEPAALAASEGDIHRWQLESEEDRAMGAFVGYSARYLARAQLKSRKKLRFKDVAEAMVIDIETYANRRGVTVEDRAEQRLRHHRATEHLLLLGQEAA